MNATQDCYRGALVGAAVGDALGATVDQLTRSEVKERYGKHREIIGGGRLGLKAGVTGPDTRMALAVAEALIAQPETDLKEVAKRLTEAYAAEKHVDGLGPITRAALENLKPKGKDIFSGAKKALQQHPASATGAGSLARVVPVGMLRRVLVKELVLDTMNVCRLTHLDPHCVDASLAFNFGVSYLTSGKDPSKLLFKTWRFLMDARGTKEYREIVGETVPEQDMVKGLKQVNEIQLEDLQPNGRAIETTQAAYWLVLNAIDFEEGIVSAATLGGDAATLGAAAGALLGARFGEQAIPERWLTALQGREALEKIADKLCKLGEPKK